VKESELKIFQGNLLLPFSGYKSKPCGNIACDIWERKTGARAVGEPKETGGP
jgi:hypothetical protein